MEYVEERKIKLDAISVVSGPGSYTGLRIGLSLAKGLAYGLDIPLITMSSLKVMAVRAIFSYPEFSGEELIIPMIDARRMEVYTGIINSRLENVMEEQPVILSPETFKEVASDTKILLIGDGTVKFQPLFLRENVVWLGDKMAHAKYMVALSEKYFRERDFSDVAYTVPNYLKEYKTTQPKNKI